MNYHQTIAHSTVCLSLSVMDRDHIKCGRCDSEALDFEPLDPGSEKKIGGPNSQLWPKINFEGSSKGKGQKMSQPISTLFNFHLCILYLYTSA